MKKVLSIIFVTIILLSFSSCKNEENIETNSSNSHENDIKVPVSESSVKHENPRTNYTKEEAVEIIDKYSDPKLKVSEDFSVDAPKKIDHVSTFLCGTTAQLAARESIEDFRSAFNFLFPNHEVQSWGSLAFLTELVMAVKLDTFSGDLNQCPELFLI